MKSVALFFVVLVFAAVAMADPRAEPSGILGVGVGPAVIGTPVLAGGWGGSGLIGARGLGVSSVGIGGVGLGGLGGLGLGHGRIW